MKTFKPDLTNILSIILILCAIFFSIKHLQLARQNQADRITLAEVTSVRYGLLDANEWKMVLSNIITKKIDEFELTEQNKEQLKAQVEDLMYKLLDQVRQILRDDMGKIKQFLMDAFVDLDKLRSNIPQLSEQLLSEMSKPENKDRLRQFVLEKLDSYVSETFNQDQQKKLNDILINGNFENKEVASVQLENRIAGAGDKIRIYSILLFVSLFAVFLINFLTDKKNTKTGLFLLLIVVLLFLANGLIVPMIDIEAKITRLTFQLLGEDIIFNNQVLFFQSKSILDVVWILITNGKADMIFVGILIFAFSVMFPVTKIISSFLSIRSPQFYTKNKFVHFFTYKSGKWSMADVFVVAIFMAFIGFSGIISDQLDQLKDAAKYVEVLTTNGTHLKSGFYFFLLFCLSGLFLSVAIQNKIA